MGRECRGDPTRESRVGGREMSNSLGLDGRRAEPFYGLQESPQGRMWPHNQQGFVLSYGTCRPGLRVRSFCVGVFFWPKTFLLRAVGTLR